MKTYLLIIEWSPPYMAINVGELGSEGGWFFSEEGRKS